MANHIFVFTFEGEETAADKLENVELWEKNGLVEIEDAVVVSRDKSNDLKIKQTQSAAKKYAAGGSAVGLLAGVLLGGPIGGLVAGAAIGAVTGKMKDVGIDDEFVKGVSEGLKQNTSALFILGRALDQDAIIAELNELEGRLLITNLPPDLEKTLRSQLK